jgi:hypothetical protein
VTLIDDFAKSDSSSESSMDESFIAVNASVKVNFFFFFLKKKKIIKKKY